MERAIKFRAKREDSDIEEEFTLEQIANLRDDYYSYDNWRQFTGLTDKNGKDIYEGDIVKNWQGGWNVVIYKSPGFEATVSADQSCLYSLEWWAEVEVIGNIRENLELLNQH